MSHRQPVDQTWIKNHPLEGDGLITGFYNFLFKRNTKTLKPCKDVFIPDTIVFNNNFPRAWYTSDLKAKEISKKQGKDLDASSIEHTFSKPPMSSKTIKESKKKKVDPETLPPNVLIVASYMSSYEVENEHGESEMCTEVEFFNESTFREFVARKHKREGILQRFILPKDHHNSVIQAVWSPLIFSCKRRTNVGSVLDKVQCDKDPYPVAVTYEGPSHFSEEGNCAVETTAQIKEICKNIVEHFYNTEHKYITRMVLYFKVDEDNLLWLLWCGSLRVSDRGTKSQMPVNLSAMFSSPSLSMKSPQGDDQTLYEADLKHLAMTHDAIFFENYVRHHSPGREAKSPTRGTNATADDDNTRMRGEKRRPGNTDENEADPDEDWKNAPGIQDQYKELCAERDLVRGAIEDIFYEAYGHFLRHDPGPFFFEVPRRVVEALSEEKVNDLMQHLRIDHVAPSEDAAGTEGLHFSIPSARRNPVSRLSDQAAKWIEDHYKAQERSLMDDAATMPKAAAAQAQTTDDATREDKEAAVSSSDDERAAPAEAEDDRQASAGSHNSSAPGAAGEGDADAEL